MLLLYDCCFTVSLERRKARSLEAKNRGLLFLITISEWGRFFSCVSNSSSHRFHLKALIGRSHKTSHRA